MGLRQARPLTAAGEGRRVGRTPSIFSRIVTALVLEACAVSVFAQATDPGAVVESFTRQTETVVFGILFALSPVFAALILWRYFKRAK